MELQLQGELVENIKPKTLPYFDYGFIFSFEDSPKISIIIEGKVIFTISINENNMTLLQTLLLIRQENAEFN
jgi:hypothetical protein